MSDYNTYEFIGTVESLRILTDDHQTIQIHVGNQYWRPKNKAQEFEALQRWINGAALIGFTPGPHNLSSSSPTNGSTSVPSTPAEDIGL